MKRTLVSVFLILVPVLLIGQDKKEPKQPPHKVDTVSQDTVHVPGAARMRPKGSTIPVRFDTAILDKSYPLTKKEIKMRESSKTFYDSAYVKFGRHKISRFLYTLFFVPPKIVTLPDTVQIIKGEAPFVQYRGKIIRRITIKTLDPFGPTVADTSAGALTWVGKTGNNTHFTTRQYVIRKNLLFKPGQKVDPILLSDNERILKEMPAIDDANIIIRPTEPAGDSVDITVITKDVFSIGVDIVSLTTGKSVFRIYDANFLGLGDRLVNEFSIRGHRAPFFREEGVSYYLTNIGGKFIDITANYFHDDDGNQNAGIQIQRGFFSNRTKWAGSGRYQYSRYVDKVNDSLKITSYFYDAQIWIGRAFFLKTKAENVRLIISEAAYNRHYYSRPFFSPDSNKQYYNTLQLLSGFSISRNNYYLSNYVFRMGKSEIIPYGERFQLTIGPEISDFYTRLYGGAEIAYGNFIKKFGYFSGRVSFSGYFLGSSFEDAILKVQARYMTFLFYTPSKRYKFRTFVITDYRTGFNFKSNNLDVANINQYLQLNKTTDDKSLKGTGALAATLSLMVYTPWYLYGFRFALLEQLQGGFVATQNRALFAARFYPGIRTGVVLANDNLIFPPLVLSVFYYPSSPSGGPWLQFLMNAETGTQFPDYNVSAPREETLQN